MENKITLKGKTAVTYVALLLILIAFAVLVAELIVHFSSKKKRVERTLTVIEPKQVLTNVYRDANKYFLGDTLTLMNNLDTYCSKPLSAVFKQTPGILTYTFARETRNGKLRKVDIISQQYKGPDSAIINARAMYTDGSAKDFTQVFIKENGIWKLGLKYGHDIK